MHFTCRYIEDCKIRRKKCCFQFSPILQKNEPIWKVNFNDLNNIHVGTTYLLEFFSRTSKLFARMFWTLQQSSQQSIKYICCEKEAFFFSKNRKIGALTCRRHSNLPFFIIHKTIAFQRSLIMSGRLDHCLASNRHLRIYNV